jgi:protein phosphatase methylesterase 1
MVGVVSFLNFPGLCVSFRVGIFFFCVIFLMSDWFKGLSNKFLSSRAGKLLLLAGTDRLDKPLMIGQMQGTPSPLPSPRHSPPPRCPHPTRSHPSPSSMDFVLRVGKYQLVVVPEAGHFVHEDVPARTAEGLIELWRRNDREAIRRVAMLNKKKPGQ